MTAPALPRPRLAPGVEIYRRDDDHLQVGLDTGHSLVLAHGPTAREVLRSIAAPPSQVSVCAERDRTSLDGRGILVAVTAPARDLLVPD